MDKQPKFAVGQQVFELSGIDHDWCPSITSVVVAKIGAINSSDTLGPLYYLEPVGEIAFSFPVPEHLLFDSLSEAIFATREVAVEEANRIGGLAEECIDDARKKYGSK